VNRKTLHLKITNGKIMTVSCPGDDRCWSPMLLLIIWVPLMQLHTE